MPRRPIVTPQPRPWRILKRRPARRPTSQVDRRTPSGRLLPAPGADPAEVPSAHRGGGVPRRHHHPAAGRTRPQRGALGRVQPRRALRRHGGTRPAGQRCAGVLPPVPLTPPVNGWGGLWSCPPQPSCQPAVQATAVPGPGRCSPRAGCCGEATAAGRGAGGGGLAAAAARRRSW